MKPLKIWKRMATRGKILTALIIFLILCATGGLIGMIYNLPTMVQGRAINSVNALFIENDTNLAPGIAQNTGRITLAIKAANSVKDQSLRDSLFNRIDLAQKMADTLNGITALYTKKADGAKVVIRNLQPLKFDTIYENLRTLDALGKTDFTATARAEFAPAEAQYAIYKEINATLDALYTDGAARTTLSEDATTEALDAAKSLVGQLENTETQSDLNFAIGQLQKSVDNHVAAQEAAEAAAFEALAEQWKAEAEAKGETQNPTPSTEEHPDNAEEKTEEPSEKDD